MTRPPFRPFLALLLALGAQPAAVTAAGTASPVFAIDPGHSSAEFSVQHLVVANVRGTIPVASGSVVVPAPGTLPSSVSATLETAGLTTQNPDRDSDLRGPDWFDVAKYPTIVFKSTSVTAGPGGSFKVSGEMTMHGVTKSVVLDCNTLGTTVERGHRRIGYTATTSFDRRDFGMNVMKTTPGGNLIAGTSVAVSLDIEAVER